MKKHLSLLVPLLALFLAFAPHSAQATLDVAGNLTQPFTIETTPATNSYIRFRRDWGSSGSTKVTINLQYRKQENGGAWGDWTTIATPSTTTVAQLYSNSIALTAGTTYKIQFRGINSSGFSTASVSGSGSANNYNITLESSSYTWSATMYGNIMSLIVGYDTDNETAAQEALAAANEIKSNYCFAGLFYNNNSSSSTYPPAINAENLIFPAVYLREGCYRNMFYQYNRMDNSFKGGLNEGPCFLATDWNNQSGSHVNYTFLNVFNQCVNLKSAHFSFTSCPTSDDFNSYSVYTTPGDGGNSGTKTLYAPAGFNPSSCSIGNWNHTVWSYDPSAEPGGGDEPGDGSVSAPAEVSVYQVTTADTTQIVYDYPATITGSTDGLTYGLVDMGYGVIWADRNIGATSTSNAGTWYYWGGTTEGIGGYQGYFYPTYGTGKTDGYQLTAAEDVATLQMGSNWHTPNRAEWYALINNTTNSGNTFSSKSSNNTLPMPGAGYRNQGSTLDASKGYYWTNELYYPATSSNQRYNSYSYVSSNTGGEWIVDYMYAYNDAKIRAVYEPSFTTHTLTITVNGQEYQYVCEEGQEVTVTAVPQPAYVFKWWSDDHSNTNPVRTFTMTSDISNKEAVFMIDPSVPQHTVTFRNWDGTQLYQTTVPEGVVPTYDGATPTKTYWEFDGWSPAITAMGNTDVTYTATFTMESAPANVNIYQGASADTTKILHSLNSVTVNGITYNPIDLGYGVAWADRNIGASTQNAVGSYFKWGATSAGSTFTAASGYAVTMSSFNDTNNKLSSSQDAATQILGASWHMPDKDEAGELKENTNISGSTFTSKSDGTKSITLPAGGYKARQKYDGTYQYYWLREFAMQVNSNTYACFAFVKCTDGIFYASPLDKDDNYSNEPYIGMPIRAVYQPTYTTFTLTITVGSKQYKYVCQAGQEITVTANANEGYEFDEWKLENGNTDATDTHLATRTFTITGNITRTATFKEVPTGSTVSIVADNTGYGSVDVATINNVPDNSPITVNSNTLTINNTTVTATVTESNTAQYTYTFTGWTDDKGKDLPETVTGGLTIRANFTQTTNTYTVTWKNGETTLEMDENVPYGTTPSYDGETPTKAADAAAEGYTYTFNAWSPAVTNVTGDATYTATFTPANKQYTLTWDFDGGTTATADGDYTHGSVAWGTAITAPANPTKDGFDFAGWDATPAATMPAANTTYTAQWAAQVSTGTIRFLNWNNEVLQSGSVAYGTTPEYTGETPTKASDLIYSYTFSGWDKAITPVDGDKDYKAVYTPADLATFTLEEDRNENDPYYGVLTQLVGKKRTVTYNRSMGADKWHVVSLPFEFNLVTHPGHPFSDNIYEMTGATYNDGYLDFNFMPMTTTMKANKPYIFYSGTPAENVVFEDVTFVDIARYTGEGSNVLISAGSVDFINTTYRKALNKENTPDKHTVYIYSNKLYYPNNNVIWMRAFRGYFYLNIPDEAIQHIRPRVLIVSGAGTATAIEASSEEETVSVKKYVENGILVIERNGVKYDAQGAKIE